MYWCVCLNFSQIHLICPFNFTLLHLQIKHIPWNSLSKWLMSTENPTLISLINGNFLDGRWVYFLVGLFIIGQVRLFYIGYGKPRSVREP